jgi:hypothetical protein
MFPLIPLLAIFAIVGGGATLVWYDRLSKEEKQKADRIACDYAKEVFNKSLEDLTNEEAKHVAMLTKRHFVN